MLFHGGVLFPHAARLEALRLMGEDGVRLFFAISGILICTRLMDEEETRGSVSFRNFYIRRLFRIQPAAIAFLLIVALLAVFGTIPFYKAGWWTALLASRNFVSASATTDGAWYTAHFWSLAIEEQFYLILPLLLLLLRNRRQIKWFAAITVVAIVWYEYLDRGAPFANHQLRSESEMCWLFLPALLALLMRRPFFRAQCIKYLPPGPVLFVVCGILCGLVFHVRHILNLWLPTFTFLVFSTVLHPESIISRFLELSFLRLIGRISYSIYLWQQLFCVFHLPNPPAGRPLDWLQHHPQNYLAPFLLALVSYFFIEKPFIRLGHKLAPPVSAGHADLELKSDRAPARK
jgi:peptidoglycan/LPS O-acetylase OafA/YrhL